MGSKGKSAGVHATLVIKPSPVFPMKRAGGHNPLSKWIEEAKLKKTLAGGKKSVNPRSTNPPPRLDESTPLGEKVRLLMEQAKLKTKAEEDCWWAFLGTNYQRTLVPSSDCIFSVVATPITMDGVPIVWTRIELRSCRVFSNSGLLLLKDLNERPIWIHCGWLSSRRSVPYLKFIHPSLHNLLLSSNEQIIDSLVDLLSASEASILVPFSLLMSEKPLIIKYFLISNS